MEARYHEVERRTNVAKAAIESAVGTEGDVRLFISHHLAEIDEAYWYEQLGASRPEPKQVLDLLELRSHWGAEAEDGIDTFDFTLPGGVTDYVIAVRFAENGEVDYISMEN